MDTAESAQKKLFKAIGLAEVAVLFMGLLYFSGYAITSMFLRNYGIPESELFRLEYIKIGLVYWLITAGTVLIPFGAFFLTRMVRTTSRLPHYYLGWIGNSLNTTIMIGIPLILAFFATRFEWYLPLHRSVLGFRTFDAAVGTGLVISAFGVICVPFLERLTFRILSKGLSRWIFRLAIEPLRFGCLIISLYLIFGCVVQVPWLSSVFGRATWHVVVSVVFVGGITAATLWIRHIRRVQGSSMVFLLIAFGACVFYYLSIATYVFGVYPAIPANRGGAMPVTEAYFEIQGHNSLFQRHIDVNGITLWGPAYILDERNGTIYFVSSDMDSWFDQFVPVNALSTSSIPFIRLQRIDDGFPRVPRTP